MNIVEVASEAIPFAKTGGLADVMGALPESLARLGNQVKLFVPFYKIIKEKNINLRKFDKTFTLSINNKAYDYEVYYFKHAKLQLEYYFIANNEFYDRTELYVDPITGKDYSDNDLRYVLFNKAVLHTLKRINKPPDIIHVHDWQSGLIPAFLKYHYHNDPFFANVKSVLTIHNLAYQGTFASDSFVNLDLPADLFYATAPFEFFGKVNFLKGAISLADKITTVSPQYAQEIQTSEMGAGLEGVLSSRKEDLVGVLNGADYKIWSPSRDKMLVHNYYHANLSGKRINKVELLNRAGLPHREKVPLVGMISRLVDQKGFDLIEEIIDDIFAMDIQMILLGTGDEKYHKLFAKVEEKYPDKFKAFLTFDDNLAHNIEGGADIFLMPSKYEPCGLNQMYSLKYGTIPIVRKVGGLADTILDYDPRSQKGTGFVFEKYDSRALLDTIKRALNEYQSRNRWVKIIKQGMKIDYSWKKAAARYTDLFQNI